MYIRKERTQKLCVFQSKEPQVKGRCLYYTPFLQNVSTPLRTSHPISTALGTLFAHSVTHLQTRKARQRSAQHFRIVHASHLRPNCVSVTMRCTSCVSEAMEANRHSHYTGGIQERDFFNIWGLCL